jgi:Tfp pilus assembly protein PilF
LVRASARKTGICIFAGGAALAVCLVLTSLQLRYWQDSLSLFVHTVNVTTDNYAAEDCLGKTLELLNQRKLAAGFYWKAVELEPDYPRAQFNLAMDLLVLGDSKSASNHLATAAALSPDNADVQYDFGIFLLQHHDTNNAAIHFEAALAARPDFPQAKQRLKEIEAHSSVNR